MENWKKYEKTYFMPPEPCYDWVKKDSIDKAPIWCSGSAGWKPGTDRTNEPG